LEVDMDAFAEAMALLEDSAGAPDRFCEPFLTVFPVDGASVSTLGDILGAEVISTSSSAARRLDELQIDLGEGPCWDAIRLGEPIAEADLAGRGRTRWPAFSAAANESVRAASIFAFPVGVGSLRFGAVDLFTRKPLVLSAGQSRQAATMARVIGRHLLRDAVDPASRSDAATSRHSQRVVHQATGIVLAQLDITAEEAQLILRAHAFSANRPVAEIAADIVAKKLGFGRADGEIEAVE
jgi:hypothetical protein